MAVLIVTKSKKKYQKAFNQIEVGQFSVNGPPGFDWKKLHLEVLRIQEMGKKEGLIMSSESMRKIRVLYQH